MAFVDVRDRYGRTQVTFRGEADAALLAQAERLRPEWVVRVTGRVIERPAAARNANLATGEIEIDARVLEVLSEAQVPPFQPDDRTEAGVELRSSTATSTCAARA